MALSGLADVEIGLEDLGDPMPALLEVGPAGVVDGQVGRLEDLADPAGDLLQVQPGQGTGIGRDRASRPPARRPRSRTGRRRSRAGRPAPCRSAGAGTRAGGCGGWSRGELGGLVALARPEVVEVRPDAVGQRPEDLVHAERVAVGIRPGAAGSGAGPGSGALRQWLSTIFWMPRIRSSTEISTPGPARAAGAPVHPPLGARAGGAGPARTGTTCR